jgi:formate hydrogenlyase subunit 5
MNIFLDTYSGAIGLNFKERAKKSLCIDLETDFNKRKIIELCQSIKDPTKCLPFIERIDQTAHNHLAICFCMILEKSNDLEPEQNVQVIRMIMLELERIYSHIIYLYEIMFYLEDDLITDELLTIRYLLIDCFEEIVGHRMFGTGHVFFGLSFNMTPGNIKLINETTETINNKIKHLLNILVKNTSIKSIFKDLAIINDGSICTGPISWITETKKDIRLSNPYLLYGETKIQEFLKNRELKVNKNSAYNRIFTIINDIECSLKIVSLMSKKYSPNYQMSDKLTKFKMPINTFLEQYIESPRGNLKMNISTNRSGELETIELITPSDINKKVVSFSLNGTIKDNLELAFRTLYISPMEIDK